jgi:hypothetical protein
MFYVIIQPTSMLQHERLHKTRIKTLLSAPPEPCIGIHSLLQKKYLFQYQHRFLCLFVCLFISEQS